MNIRTPRLSILFVKLIWVKILLGVNELRVQQITPADGLQPPLISIVRHSLQARKGINEGGIEPFY